MPDRQRILHLGPDPGIGGGMAAALRALLDSPLAREFELEVVATYRRPDPLDRLRVFLGALLRLLVWSLRGRGRVVHIHATVRGSAYRKAVCVLVAKALRRRVILQIHSGPGDIEAFGGRLSSPARFLLTRSFARADTVVAVSAASAAAAERAYRIAGVVVVPNAAPPVVPVERPRPLPDGVVEVVYLGGFANEAKGGDDMVAAAREVLAGEPRVRFAFAGPGDPPPGLTDDRRLRWLGWLDEPTKAELLRSAHVQAISSRSEGLPMALLEAMSNGLAIVATAVGGIPETLGDGEGGIVVPPGAPDELAAAILRLVGDDDLRERLGAGAAERAERLDAAVVARRFGELYAALV